MNMPNERDLETSTGAESTAASHSATPAAPAAQATRDPTRSDPTRSDPTRSDPTGGDPTLEPTLGQLVSSLTARAPDTVLALFVVVGIVGAGLVWLVVPVWWRVVPAFVLLSAVGGWGIADRERESQGRRRVVVAVVRAAAVLGSLIAAATLVLIFMGVTLGSWIS